MAINPDNVFIVNPDDLDTASSISNVDYVIIGQGNKYKTIAYTLFTTTFLGSITTQVNTLNDEVVKHVIQVLNPTQKQTARDNIEAVGVGDVANVIKDLSYDAATNTITYTKFDNTTGVLSLNLTETLHKHTITSADVSSTIVSLTLLHTPNINEWNFLYISSGAVSPESYSVSGNVLNIDTSTLDYPLVAGKLITFRYRY